MVQARHGLAPEAVRERADLLFEFPERALHAGTAQIKGKDVGRVEGQIRTKEDEPAFALPDKDNAEFLIKSLSPEQVLGIMLRNGVFSTNLRNFFYLRACLIS